MCKHTAMMRLDVADYRQAAPMADAVQRAVEHRQPAVGAELLGDVGLCVAHQALELLPGGFDVGAVDPRTAPTASRPGGRAGGRCFRP